MKSNIKPNNKVIDLIDKFNLKNKLLFKKFRALTKISSGLVEVYNGINIKNKQKVYIKFENKLYRNNLLQTEVFTLLSVKGIGIPEIYSYGQNQNFYILVQPLLGNSLFDIYIGNNHHFEIKDICLLSIQILERLKWIHSKSFIHRDIKPQNFLIGLEDPNLIYLVNYGLSIKFRSDTSGKHIIFKNIHKFVGTIKFASINALRGWEQSRRDDLESFGYSLVFLMKGFLPWDNIKTKQRKENYYKISDLKKIISPKKLCERLPSEISEYVTYVKYLRFQEEPNYDYLQNLFKNLLSKINNSNKIVLNFSWTNSKSIINLKKCSINLHTRKSSSQKRLYSKIKDNLEKERHSHEQGLTKLINKSNFLSRNISNQEITSSFYSQKNIFVYNLPRNRIGRNEKSNNKNISSFSLSFKNDTNNTTSAAIPKISKLNKISWSIVKKTKDVNNNIGNNESFCKLIHTKKIINVSLNNISNICFKRNNIHSFINKSEQKNIINKRKNIENIYLKKNFSLNSVHLNMQNKKNINSYTLKNKNLNDFSCSSSLISPIITNNKSKLIFYKSRNPKKAKDYLTTNNNTGRKSDFTEDFHSLNFFNNIYQK